MKTATLLVGFTTLAIAGYAILGAEDPESSAIATPTAEEGDVEQRETKLQPARTAVQPTMEAPPPSAPEVEAQAPVVTRRKEPYALEDWATIGLLVRDPVPDSVFDEKYPDSMTYDELNLAWIGLSLKWQQDALQLGLEALERGDYEVREMPFGDNGEVLGDWTGHGTHTPHAVFQTGGECPPDHARVSWLRYDEHPELYDRRDEINYLQARREATRRTD
jgi:hypothetical protein